MTSPSLPWLQTGTGRIQKWHLFLLPAFLVLPNAVHATDCLVSPVLPCTFTLTEPFNASNWPTQPIDFRYDGGFAMVKTAKMINSSGTEIPFQWVSSCWDSTAIFGCIEIQDALPAGATQTYTLEAGPPSATVSNPVVVTNNVACYSGGATCIQISNGITGVQVPTVASNGAGASYRLAPIQAIGLPNGGWTGAIGGSGNPNIIYGESTPGLIPNYDGLKTAITTATGYSAKFLEYGPLKTVLQLTYSFNRPDYYTTPTKFYYTATCTPANSTYPDGYISFSGGMVPPNGTVIFNRSGFCPVGAGSAPLDTAHYYTATAVAGVTGAYTLTTVSGGVVTPVIITGTATGSQQSGFIINSATGCSNGCQDSSPGRLVVTLTLYANSKSVLVLEDSDMLYAAYYPFYKEITPDTARWRARLENNGLGDPRCGYYAPTSVTAVGTGSGTATITTSSAMTNGSFVLLTGVGSGSTLPNGVYYLQTSSPYSATSPGVWTNYSGGTFSGATTAPSSYITGGLVKAPATYQHSNAVPEGGFDFPWAYGDTGFSEAAPWNSLFTGCEISAGHLYGTPPLVVDYPASDYNDVWAWENYSSTGGSTSPVLGWYTGDAALMKNAVGTMPGLYVAASGFVSGWGRTTALSDQNWIAANGVKFPTLDNWGSQRSWAIYVDTNGNLPPFSSTHPPIQDDQNKLTGVNLSHIYAYHATSTSTPSGGWKWLYMANSNATSAGQEMACLIARVQDGSSTCAGLFPDGRRATPCSSTQGSTCYHDLLYNNSTTDPASRALLNKWQNEKPYPYIANFGDAFPQLYNQSTQTELETVANTGDLVVAELSFFANSSGTANTGCTISASDGTAATFSLVTGGTFLTGYGYSFAYHGTYYTAIFVAPNAVAGTHTLTFTISGTGCSINYAYSTYRDIVGGASLDMTASTYVVQSSASTSLNLTTGTIGAANEVLLFDAVATASPSVASPFSSEAVLSSRMAGYMLQAPAGGTQTAVITQSSTIGSGFILGIVPSSPNLMSPVVNTLMNVSGCPATMTNVGSVLVSGDNHLADTTNYYQIALYFEPCYGIWNDVLIDPNSTTAQKSQMATEASFFGGIMWDNSWFPWDGSFTNYTAACYGCFVVPSADGTGLQNQQVQYAQDRASIVYQYGVNGANSFLATKVPLAAASTSTQLQQSIGCKGAVIGGTHYQSTYNSTLLPNFQITALQGSSSFANQCPFTQGLPEWYLATTTPPDPRYGNLRKKMADGDTTAEEADPYPGLLATDLYTTNPTTAGWMSWLWHQYGTSTFQYLNGATNGLLLTDETIPQITPVLASQQIDGDFAVHRVGVQGGGQETALWFINGGNSATQPIYYSQQGHRGFDDGQVTLFALGAPLAMDWGADLYNPAIDDRFSHNSITFDGELNGTSWSQSNPPFQTYGMTLLGSPTVTAFQAFGSSVQSAAAFTYTPGVNAGGDGTIWTRAVRTMAPDPKYPIFYIKDTFSGGSGGYKTLTWNMEATGAVSTPSGSKTPTTSFNNGCSLPAVHLPSANDSSGLAPYALSNGLQQFSFTGFSWPQYAGTNLKWNLYERPTSGNAQWLIGNWGHGCGVGFEQAQFQAANASASWYGSPSNACNSGNNTGFCDWQHILRVHDTGPFETVITPTVASGAPPSVSYNNGVYTATFGSNESLLWNDSYSTFTNGVTQVLTTYNSSTQSAFSMTASGGPQEIANNGAGTITWTIEDVNPATRSVTLPPGAWYPAVPVQQSGGVYTYYHAGGAEPSAAVVTFTQTPVTLRSVPLNYAAPPGAAQIRVKFGSSTNYAAIAACNPLCSIVMQSPVGTWPEQHDFLDGNGNVIASSQVRNVVVQ